MRAKSCCAAVAVNGACFLLPWHPGSASVLLAARWMPRLRDKIYNICLFQPLSTHGPPRRRRSRGTKYAALAVAVLAGIMANAAAAAPLIIGILEERPSGDWGSSPQNVVRVGFMKAGSEWAALRCKDPEEAFSAVCRALALPEAPVTWTVYYRGNVLGTVKSTSWIIPDVSYEGALATAPGRVPAVGTPSKDFAGWTNMNAHRPLIAINSAVPPFTSRWEKDEPRPELLAAAWPVFQSVVSTVDVCAKDSDAVSIHTLRQEDVKPMPGWRSRSGELLLRLGVDPSLQANCEMWSSPDLWLFRDPGGDLRVLPDQVWNEHEGTNFNPSLEPLDAGDFDGDGGEEAIFFFSGYNFDGYILYYDSFRKSVRFGWSYH